MKKLLIRVTALAAALLLLGSGVTVFAARPKGYDAEGCMPLITEPGESAEPLIFCRGDKDLAIDEVNWVDDGQGKAVRFNGVDEYFRMDGKNLQIGELTLSMWVKWEGPSDEENGSELLGQRIFSARGADRDRQYITLSPMETTGEGEDALCVYMQYEDSDWELDDPQSEPLPQDAWHHLAVVMDGQKLSLYLDGALIDEQLTMMSFAQMRPQQLCLGRGSQRGGDGYFNGLMDNVYLYKKALSSDALAALYEEQLPDELTATTTTTTATATTTTTTQSVPDNAPSVQQDDTSLPPIPPIVWIVTGVVAALIGALIVTENRRYAREHQPPTQ